MYGTSNSQFKLMKVEGIAPKIGTSEWCQKLILALGCNVLGAYKQVTNWNLSFSNSLPLFKIGRELQGA